MLVYKSKHIAIDVELSYKIEDETMENISYGIEGFVGEIVVKFFIQCNGILNHHYLHLKIVDYSKLKNNSPLPLPGFCTLHDSSLYEVLYFIKSLGYEIPADITEKIQDFINERFINTVKTERTQ